MRRRTPLAAYPDPMRTTPMDPYLALLRVGFTLPRVLPRAVRSYRTISPLPPPKRVGGIFSVALSVGLRPPGVTWHPVLWSPDFPPAEASDCLAGSSAEEVWAPRRGNSSFFAPPCQQGLADKEAFWARPAERQPP